MALDALDLLKRPWHIKRCVVSWSYGTASLSRINHQTGRKYTFPTLGFEANFTRVLSITETKGYPANHAPIQSQSVSNRVDSDEHS